MLGFRRGVILAGRFVRAAAAIHMVHTYLFEFTATGGLSMMPTLHTKGDHAFVNKLNYRRGHNIHVGDVIVVNKPTQAHSRICKRVAALPGDIVYCNEMPSYNVSDNSIDIPSEVATAQLGNERTGKFVRIPEGHVWILGDNASASLDSRAYGPVPQALIVGKVTHAVYWNPFDILPNWPRKLLSNFKISEYDPAQILQFGSE
ncbi:peptidase S24/S26A/S26B/S26C [Lipomyces arxii]|uniref:peptidase S24/S26A/S26B/S26C n=1 Tax=Lipomyces arxii TaxID=56418 RepID=UPI0034CF8452